MTVCSDICSIIISVNKSVDVISLSLRCHNARSSIVRINHRIRMDRETKEYFLRIRPPCNAVYFTSVYGDIPLQEIEVYGTKKKESSEFFCSKQFL